MNTAGGTFRCPRCSEVHAAPGDGCPPAARIDEILGGRYRIVRRLGGRPSSRVYEAQHTQVGRRFAVRLLDAALAADEGSVAAFRREAEGAGRLESEHVVAPVDTGTTEDGVPYVVMELLGGERLQRLLEREAPLPPARAVDIAVQTCRAVAAIDAAGVAHGVLTPEDLFICRRGDGSDLVKVLRLGGGGARTDGGDRADGSATLPGGPLGTPSSLPPEPIEQPKNGEHHQGDVLAIGDILIEALTGSRPEAPGAAELPAARPDLPAALVGAVRRARARAPEERPASAAELARNLTAVAAVLARAPRATEETAPPAAAPEAPPSPRAVAPPAAIAPAPVDAASGGAPVDDPWFDETREDDGVDGWLDQELPAARARRAARRLAVAALLACTAAGTVVLFTRDREPRAAVPPPIAVASPPAPAPSPPPPPPPPPPAPAAAAPAAPPVAASPPPAPASAFSPPAVAITQAATFSTPEAPAAPPATAPPCMPRPHRSTAAPSPTPSPSPPAEPAWRLSDDGPRRPRHPIFDRTNPYR